MKTAKTNIEDLIVRSRRGELTAEEERRLNQMRIAETLDRISDRYRRAIQLRLIDELPRAECALKMEVS